MSHPCRHQRHLWGPVHSVADLTNNYQLYTRVNLGLSWVSSSNKIIVHAIILDIGREVPIPSGVGPKWSVFMSIRVTWSPSTNQSLASGSRDHSQPIRVQHLARTHRRSRWPPRCRWLGCRGPRCSSPPRCPRSGCRPAPWGRGPPGTAPGTRCSRSGCPRCCCRSIACWHCLKQGKY